MDAQVENAIELAFTPFTDPNLKSQAYDFLNQLRVDPNGWQVCLSLFIRTPLSSEVVRLVSLEIVNNAVQTQNLGQQSLIQARDALVGYMRQRYGTGGQDADSPSIQNKFTQTATYLFTALYPSEWTTFFDDFRGLSGDAQNIGTNNPSASILYLRVVGSVHDEIGDVLIPRTAEEQRRSNELKDLVRARDANKIAATWQEILSRWREIDLTIVEMCLRTIAKWVSWIDIWLVINGNIQNALLEIAGQLGTFNAESKEAKARDAAIDTFTETVGKKMAASDKVELIGYLNLASIVGQLVSSPALSDLNGTPDYDTDLAETVAKLVNNVVFDIVRVLDTDTVVGDTRTKADGLLQDFVPYLLRFFSDEYDEVCSTVIPSLTDLITMFRRMVKAKGGLEPHFSAMLQPILNSVIVKMRYDETASWGTEDDLTDEAEFQELRKRLYVLQQTIAAVDETLYINTVSKVVAENLNISGNSDWRDIDLALHEMYLFGELAIRNGGLYNKSAPSSEASQRLLEMMDKMVESGLASYPHPAIQLQYMEICVRYVQYFEHNASNISKGLETFIGFVHSNNVKVRLRSWYLFQRFVKHLRTQVGDMAQEIVQAVGDLLTIKAELPEDRDEDEASSEDNDQSADAAFTSQLFLFEAIGCVASSSAVPLATKVNVARAVIAPLSANLNDNVEAARNGDARATLQIHHVIMAFGSLANGYSDWTPGSKTGGPPATEVSDEFAQASEAVLVALHALKGSSEVRTAARHSFSRFMGVVGVRILPELPRWIDGLLSSASSNDEMAMFLRLLGQVVFGFKAEIFDILDQLLSPLLQKVMMGLSNPATGTDDEIQLRELKLQYLNFLQVIMNQELGAVLVSPTNQGTFDTFLNTVIHFSRDPSDPPTARLALSVLTHMTSTWGGPDVSPSSTQQPAPVLPGFDTFILSSFAPIPWSLISSPGFNSGDAQIRSVLQEAAALQWTILRKIGVKYREQLQGELVGLGVPENGVMEYLKNIEGDVVGFRKFFAGFVRR